MKIFFVFLVIVMILGWYSNENKELKELMNRFFDTINDESRLLDRFISYSDKLEQKYDDWGYTCCKVKKGYKFCIACCDKWEVASCNIGFNDLNCTCKS